MVVGDEVIVASRDGFIKVVNRKDAKEVFSIKLDYKMHQGPIVVDGLIYVVTMDNYLVAIE